ncbi:ankyrin repeat domain-containing protein [Lusitaniella coriacea]|uniref:ankyrin repeat domain-containing protein n=1 Tax=Lusitaniella coriacea TaxID=1983105 RepID=UPI003CF132A1
MNISVLFLYVWIIGTLGFIFWRVLTNPITRIHGAVMNNDIETVRSCLDKGVDPDVRKGQGVTPLCIATYDGNREIAELLLDRGAEINQGLEEENGVNPLLNAARFGDEEFVKILLARGAKIGLHFAALQGDIDVVKEYLERGSPIQSMRNRGMTPLHLAALGNQRETAELLLEYGADINFETPASETALHQAVRGQSKEVIELLADRGADLNPIGLAGTPLQLAILENDIEIVRLLIAKGADVNAGNSRVNFPLHTVARTDTEQAEFTFHHVARTEAEQVEMVELLIANGAKVNACPNRSPRTPLHWAANRRNLEVARALIRHGADVNSHNFLSGITPLSEARGNQEMTDLLIAHGATNYGWVD